ncbi:MAG: carboxypeptidase regulatory-like domain-containing protein [Nitrososphaeraceae archaeon]|nr:carboxypeptidase regulatory-like domain-containing protein [Nitrososphaeraceae archaeon]
MTTSCRSTTANELLLGLHRSFGAPPKSSQPGKLVCEKGTAIAGNPGIAGATIAFTGSGVHPNAVAKTDSDGNFYMSGPEEPGTYDVQAHFYDLLVRQYCLAFLV